MQQTGIRVFDSRLHVGFGVLFLDDDVSTPVTEPDQTLDLLAAQGSSICLHTGIASGWVRVAVDVLPSKPVAKMSTPEGFEESAELTVARGQSTCFTLSATSALPPDDVEISKPQGPWIRIRVDATGRRADWDLAVGESRERYLITVWPEESFRPPSGRMPLEPPPNPEIERAIREAMAELEARGPVDHAAPQQFKSNR